MIRLSEPSAETIERYRASRELDDPTFGPTTDSDGFHTIDVVTPLGSGDEVFAAASEALRRWSVHERAGVRVVPRDAALRVDETVAIVTRQAGLWILASCRITDVVDTPRSFGFTYATLPDHPECGEESFTIEIASDGAVTFVITAIWRSDAWLARLGFPVAKWLQRRASQAYLDAMLSLASTI